MNKEMYERALAAIRDPAFGAALVADIHAKRAALATFEQSPLFRAMVSSIAENPEPVCIDSEQAAYFPDDVREAAGWPVVSKDDIDMFFRVMCNSAAATVTPDSLSEDEDCSFDNESFTNHGLTVFRMSGQGTFIRISNR